MRHYQIALSLLSAAVLSACGGSGSEGPAINTSVARGTLYANPPNLVPIPQASGPALTKLDPVVFKAMLEAKKPGLTQVTGTPKCEISTYYMKYATVGGANEATDATGAIMVPSGSDPACTGPRPVLLYAHGTTVEKSFNMANLRDNSEASLVAAMYAAQGFIVVASNFAGYDVSSLTYHPYLNADQQADDMVDSLRAARAAFPRINAQDSGKLVIAGYSQGGHVAMATQRAMQQKYASEFKVSALAGMSGPYAMALLGDAVFAGSPNAGGTVFLPMITTSWQKSYGNIYASANEIYEDKYATGIETLIPGGLTMTDLFTTGKLPSLAMFAKDSLPGPSTPAFSGFFGDGNLIKTSYRNAYLADAQKNPCGTNPADPLNCSPANAFRKAGVKNDLRNYVPNVPVMLCGGGSDPTVFFASTQATAGFFLAKGFPSAYLTTLDVDTNPTSAADPFAAAKVGFAQSKAGVIAAAVAAKQDPATAVASVYHGTLVPPFCNAAARGFFQQVLAK
ncbi:prolyl oligopeptidase family serine peptidase [Undibacterium sp. FT147W]|uniref:Prolyl oligopeptidase family serine peptidase n=1 Tax=Undibacterium rivi TaxID=2828729 RepID=A0ABS5H537_9BURK|nr:lipase family protein [Undibacterium rivi]MBR7793514.1 prolyl oligopeptidase family serine peptidase [Undibacterium rivi]